MNGIMQHMVNYDSKSPRRRVYRNERTRLLLLEDVMFQALPFHPKIGARAIA